MNSVVPSCLCMLLLLIGQGAKAQTNELKFKGVTLAPSKEEISYNPFIEIKELGANWVCLVPYAYSQAPDYSIDMDEYDCWWGNSMSGLEKNIIWAKELGLQVLLKPQIFVEDAWPGIIEFASDQDWENWEIQYRNFVFEYLEMAISLDVDMFCIGTELKLSVDQRPSFWIDLIKDIRQQYKGLLIYSANWDSYENVEFWDQCDLISISSYFPLSENSNPDIEELNEKWKPIVRKLKNYSIKKGKGLLFTEYGYHSVSRAAGKHWLIEDRLEEETLDQNAQNTAYESLYSMFWNEAFWKGGFLWKWYPDLNAIGDLILKDYSPQNKKALTTIKKWFNSKTKS